MLSDVMHRLSPAAWKVVTIMARDDLLRQAEEDSPIGALRRDVFNSSRIDVSQPTEPEERSDLTVVEDSSRRWTRLSLAEICRGVRIPAKQAIKNRGTGLAKSSAVCHRGSRASWDSKAEAAQ
jgi:hypothetical protein